MATVVLIGGWGHWGKVIVEAAKLSGVEFGGIAPAFTGEDLSTVTEHPVLKHVPLFASAAELLNQAGKGIAVVSTRPGRIAAAVIQAAEAGFDVIAEKPVGITLEEIAAVEAAVRKNRVRLMAMLSMRGSPVFQTVRRLVREGAVGRPVLVNSRKSYKYGDPEKRPEWFGDRAEYGGTFPWVGIHALDLVVFTTGLRPRQVAALQRNQAHPERPACEDSCCAIFELEGGAQATVSADYFRPESAATHGDDWVRIVGTEGILEARANESLVTLLKNGKSPEPVPLDEAEKLFAPFIEGREGLTDAADAIELSRACVYARQAADEARVIKTG